MSLSCFVFCQRGRFCQHADIINETRGRNILYVWNVATPHAPEILRYDWHSLLGTRQPPGKLDPEPPGASRLMRDTEKGAVEVLVFPQLATEQG